MITKITSETLTIVVVVVSSLQQIKSVQNISDKLFSKTMQRLVIIFF